MDLNNDWRLAIGQIDYLKGVTLWRSKWFCPNKDWDHDHCEFCGGKLDASTEALAYRTDDLSWICEKCYQDFKEAFEWVLVDEEGETDGKTD